MAPYKTHLAYVRERRSDADAERLLNEALAKLRGDDVAKTTQLLMEYDPQPPFNAGSPKAAGPALTQQLLASLEPINLQIRQIAAEMATEIGAGAQA